nr:MAG TPA: hypothetical protein [Caudoviricetes sp.]
MVSFGNLVTLYCVSFPLRVGIFLQLSICIYFVS